MAEECLMSSSLSRPQQSFHTFNTVARTGNNLECRVCEEGFSVGGDKVPRLLYCGHTLCHSCLLRLPLSAAANNEAQATAAAASPGGGEFICCPFDRQPTPVDSTGVWGLKKNFALLEVLERCGVGASGEDRVGARPLLSPDLLTHHQQGLSPFLVSGCGGTVTVPCDEDESHAAVLYCTVCASHLCAACSERSHATRTLHTHRRIPLADKPREKPRCSAHPSHTVEFICLEPGCLCSSPLMCFICKDYKHTKHKHALLESEAESVRQELSAAAHNIKRTALQLTHTLRKLEQTAHLLDEHPTPESVSDMELTANEGPMTANHPLSSNRLASSASLSAIIQCGEVAIPASSASSAITAVCSSPASNNPLLSGVLIPSSQGGGLVINQHGSIGQHHTQGGGSSVVSSGGSQAQHLSSSPLSGDGLRSSLMSGQSSTVVNTSNNGSQQSHATSNSSHRTNASREHVSSASSHMVTARGVVRSHFTALRQQLHEQENVAMSALETHVRERLCSIRQQQEDLSSLISQMVGLVLDAERCLQQDDGRVLVTGRSLTAKLHVLQQQQPQLDAIEQGLSTVEDNIPITFTKDNRIHIGAVLEMRVVTLGLDGAGKTSILFQLQQSTCLPTIPTIGFNVETLHYKNFKFTVWDVGGQPKLRPLWRHYYYNTQAVIFVVDASDPDRLEEAAAELTKLMMERELRDAPLLLYANKQSVPDALSPSDVSLALGAGKLCSGRPWHVVACDARTGDGLTDGLDWLTRQLGPLTT